VQLVDPRIEDYAERFTTPHDPLLAELSAASDAAFGQHSMLTGPVAGRLLELLVWLGQPKRVVEIGTFSGHSALAMAAALPADGHLDACELRPERAEFAQSWFDRSPHGSKITLHVGPALETLATLDGEFDFVFIDADKPSNPLYLKEAIRLSRPGTGILVDNVVREGAVLDPRSSDDRVAGTRALFEAVAAEPQLAATAIQTVGVKKWDGFLLALVVG
jgi:predicted O-methyltransferase YrrM